MPHHCQATEFCLGCCWPSWLPGQQGPQELPVDTGPLPVHEIHTLSSLPGTLLAAELMGRLVCVDMRSLSSSCGFRCGLVLCGRLMLYAAYFVSE